LLSVLAPRGVLDQNRSLLIRDRDHRCSSWAFASTTTKPEPCSARS